MLMGYIDQLQLHTWNTSIHSHLLWLIIEEVIYLGLSK